MHDEEKSDAQVAALLKMAGRRPRVPEEMTARVREVVHEEWLRTARKRTRNRVLFALAAAAVILAFGALLMRAPEDPALEPPRLQAIATVELINGSVIARDPHPRVIAGGGELYAGSALETGTAALATLVWQDRASLRLAPGTVVRFETAEVMSLQRGAVYFSSTKPGSPITIRTPRGEVRDIGTQFEVRVEGGGDVRVRVREGKVEMGTEIAEAGTELFASAGGVTRQAIATTGAEWDWVLAAAPPIALEGTLSEVLGRVAREKGLIVRFADPKLGALTLHGNVPLTPDEALDAAAQATGVRAKVRGGELVVSR